MDEYRILAIDGMSPDIRDTKIGGLAFHLDNPFKAIIQKKVGNEWVDVEFPIVFKHLIDGAQYDLVNGKPSVRINCVWRAI